MIVNLIFGHSELNNIDVDGDNCTVEHVFKTYKEVLNIPEGAQAFVEGIERPYNYNLRDGETLEFKKLSGNKG